MDYTAEYIKEREAVIANLFSKVEVADKAMKEVQKIHGNKNNFGLYNLSGSQALYRLVGAPSSTSARGRRADEEINKDISLAILVLDRLKTNLVKMIDRIEKEK